MTFGKYFTVMLATAIKFFNGPIAGIVLGLTWWETAICCIIGMMTTVTLIALLGSSLQRILAKYRKNQPKLFSKRSRFAVKIWKKLGVWGIACFTPLFFTPVGGTLLALSFKVPFFKIFFSMLLFAVSWGLFFSYLLFQVTWLKELFA